MPSLDRMKWPDGPNPAAPELPGVGDLVELGEAAGLPKGHRSFVARVAAISSAGPDRVHLAVVRDDVTPERRYYASLLVKGIQIIEKAQDAS